MALPSAGTSLGIIVLTGLWSVALAVVLPRWLAASGMVRENFLGIRIPTACGLAVIIGATPPLVWLASSTTAAHSRAASAMLVALLGFGALGFADDRWGTPAAKGLRGHIRMLLVERRVTSGLVKAFGGSIVALIVAAMHFGPPWYGVLLRGAIIALSANLANLLDLRPGRASTVVLMLLAGTTGAMLAAGNAATALAAACVAVPALVLYVPDSRGRLMLGDTGSNALGACAGISLLMAAPGPMPLMAILLGLVAIHGVAERWSLSAIIEANPILRALDRLTGIRTTSAATGRGTGEVE
jgi:UDP-N-acetylmuramyl pentapeptide phosphotransferase/UDP-N-acetylglucosamine-1-phosphate transferase